MATPISKLVSGANIETWDNNTNLNTVEAKTYLIDFRGITIGNLGICGSGFSLLTGLYTTQFGISNWGIIYRYCETNLKNWTPWRFV